MSWHYALAEVEPSEWRVVEVYLDANAKPWGFVVADLNESAETRADWMANMSVIWNDARYRPSIDHETFNNPPGKGPVFHPGDPTYTIEQLAEELGMSIDSQDVSDNTERENT